MNDVKIMTTYIDNLTCILKNKNTNNQIFV